MQQSRFTYAGTDVNENITIAHEESATPRLPKRDLDAERPDPDTKAAIILEACKRATAIVAFTEGQRSKFATFARSCCTDDMLRSMVAKTRVIQQGVVGEAPGGADQGQQGNADHDDSRDPVQVDDQSNLRNHLGVPSNTFICLLVAGLRPVKAPTFICSAFAEWHHQQRSFLETARASSVTESFAGVDSESHDAPSLQDALLAMSPNESSSSAFKSSPPVCLVTVGPALDDAVHATVCSLTGIDSDQRHPHGGRDGLYYHPPVPRSTLLSWIQQSNCLVNTSVSEGQCNAVLEAMMVGCPVVARRNEGNAAIVEHGVTGWLFDTPEEGVGMFKQLYTAATHGADAAVRATGTDDASLSPQAVSAVVDAARDYVGRCHSPGEEAKAWWSLLNTVVDESKSSSCSLRTGAG